jgi:site-specific recombinase XerD
MLGHKHIATTQIYAKMPDVMVERQAEKLFKIG